MLAQRSCLLSLSKKTSRNWRTHWTSSTNKVRASVEPRNNPRGNPSKVTPSLHCVKNRLVSNRLASWCSSVSLSDLRGDGVIWKSTNSTQLKSFVPEGPTVLQLKNTGTRWDGNKKRWDKQEKKTKTNKLHLHQQITFGTSLRVRFSQTVLFVFFTFWKVKQAKEVKGGLLTGDTYYCWQRQQKKKPYTKQDFQQTFFQSWLYALLGTVLLLMMGNIDGWRYQNPVQLPLTWFMTWLNLQDFHELDDIFFFLASGNEMLLTGA